MVGYRFGRRVCSAQNSRNRNPCELFGFFLLHNFDQIAIGYMILRFVLIIMCVWHSDLVEMVA